jgi:hypothetical protein
MGRLTIIGLALATLALAGGAAPALAGGTGNAARGDDGGGGQRGARTFGPTTIATTDNGSCGNAWAAATLRRTYSVRSNGDGTFTLAEADRGAFVTVGGSSPGACETGSAHGLVVLPGRRGSTIGLLVGTVSCAGACVLDPAGAAACGTAAAASPCYRDVFVAAAFGPTARWSCLQGSDPCTFRFDYVAHDQGLVFHHWVDEGTASSERFSGDIASS